MKKVVYVGGVRTLVSGQRGWVLTKCPELVAYHQEKLDKLRGNGRNKRGLNKGYIPIDRVVMQEMERKRIEKKLGYRVLSRKTGISHTRLRGLLQGKQPSISPQNWERLKKELL